ncbi:MAG TPA: hypothetical protein VIK30_14655 [Polyangia bacterium]
MAFTTVVTVVALTGTGTPDVGTLNWAGAVAPHAPSVVPHVGSVPLLVAQTQSGSPLGPTAGAATVPKFALSTTP